MTDPKDDSLSVAFTRGNPQLEVQSGTLWFYEPQPVEKLSAYHSTLQRTALGEEEGCGLSLLGLGADGPSPAVTTEDAAILSRQAVPADFGLSLPNPTGPGLGPGPEPPPPERRGPLLAVLNLPAHLVPLDLLRFLRPVQRDVRSVAALRHCVSAAQYLAVVRFASAGAALAAWRGLHGRPLNGLEPYTAYLAFARGLVLDRPPSPRAPAPAAAAAGEEEASARSAPSGGATGGELHPVSTAADPLEVEALSRHASSGTATPPEAVLHSLSLRKSQGGGSLGIGGVRETPVSVATGPGSHSSSPGQALRPRPASSRLRRPISDLVRPSQGASNLDGDQEDHPLRAANQLSLSSPLSGLLDGVVAPSSSGRGTGPGSQHWGLPLPHSGPRPGPGLSSSLLPLDDCLLPPPAPRPTPVQPHSQAKPGECTEGRAGAGVTCRADAATGLVEGLDPGVAEELPPPFALGVSGDSEGAPPANPPGLTAASRHNSWSGALGGGGSGVHGRAGGGGPEGCCVVCLEPMEGPVPQVFTTVCNHTFHMDCLGRWADSPCPVCRFHPSRADAYSRCAACGAGAGLWCCLLCGQIGCGKRGPDGHARAHYEATLHCYALEVDTQHVWDFAGGGYVHRLIGAKADDGDGGPGGGGGSPKLVEVAAPGGGGGARPRAPPGTSKAEEQLVHRKLEGLAFQYTTAVAAALEAQRRWYEQQLAGAREAAAAAARGGARAPPPPPGAARADLRQARARAREAAARLAKAREEGAFLGELGRSLRGNAAGWAAELGRAEAGLREAEAAHAARVGALEAEVARLMGRLDQGGAGEGEGKGREGGEGEAGGGGG